MLYLAKKKSKFSVKSPKKVHLDTKRDAISYYVHN